MDDRLSEAMQRLGEAITETWDAFVELFATVYDAISDAPPRVKHRARYSKKGRTRKKNLRKIIHKR